MAKANEMFQCQMHYCGYVYNPDEGDPKRGITAGTKFGELPDDWTCPFCGAEKKDFKPLAGPGSVLWENVRNWPGLKDKQWEEIEKRIASGDVQGYSPVAQRAKGKMV